LNKESRFFLYSYYQNGREQNPEKEKQQSLEEVEMLEKRKTVSTAECL
jgi:hypothetical protein